MTERAAPMYCPYCGEDSIRPWDVEPTGDGPARPAAGWRCESCLRVFSVRYRGLTGRD